LVRGPKRELFLSSHDRLTLGGGFSRLPYEIGHLTVAEVLEY